MLTSPPSPLGALRNYIAHYSAGGVERDPERREPPSAHEQCEDEAQLRLRTQRIISAGEVRWTHLAPIRAPLPSNVIRTSGRCGPNLIGPVFAFAQRRRRGREEVGWVLELNQHARSSSLVYCTYLPTFLAAPQRMLRGAQLMTSVRVSPDLGDDGWPARPCWATRPPPSSLTRKQVPVGS